MEKWIVILICVGLIYPMPVSAQKKNPQAKKAIKEKTVSESRQVPEIPPAIQKMMEKELEKLPPVKQHFRRAQNYNAMGKTKKAIEELNLALKQDPKDVPSNCELGVIYMGQGNYSKAIAQLKKTLALDPKYPKTHYALANAYARKPKPDTALARKHLDEAIRLGYHPVPWFLDYMKRLEGKGTIPPKSASGSGANKQALKK